MADAPSPKYEGYTLDELDQFGTMATLPLPLDHPAWKTKPFKMPAADDLPPPVAGGAKT